MEENNRNELYNSKKLKTLGLILSIAIMFIVYYELKLLDLLIGIFKIEKLNQKIAKVSFKSLTFITKENDDEAFIDEMRRLGWRFKNVYGRGYLFEKNREEVIAVRREHFKYTIYEVSPKTFFESKNA